jgi:hypothetical protein
MLGADGRNTPRPGAHASADVLAAPSYMMRVTAASAFARPAVSRLAMTDDAEPATIEIRVETIGQLFDRLDPMPLAQRDLSGPTDEFIYETARELPRNRPFRILVYITRRDGDAALAAVATAIRAHYRYRANRRRVELRELFRVGRVALAIGATVMALCITAGQLLTTRLGDGYLGSFFNESLIILGWVANWRPLEIFLYDWWPLVRDRLLLERLAKAEVACRVEPIAGD